MEASGLWRVQLQEFSSHQPRSSGARCPAGRTRRRRSSRTRAPPPPSFSGAVQVRIAIFTCSRLLPLLSCCFTLSFSLRLWERSIERCYRGKLPGLWRCILRSYVCLLTSRRGVDMVEIGRSQPEGPARVHHRHRPTRCLQAHSEAEGEDVVRHETTRVRHQAGEGPGRKDWRRSLHSVRTPCFFFFFDQSPRVTLCLSH